VNGGSDDLLCRACGEPVVGPVSVRADRAHPPDSGM
jgi:hypothetical protein